MVPPWRESAHDPGHGRLYLDGFRDADVNRFLLPYENMIMRGTEEGEKELDIVCYFSEMAFNAYYENFSDDGELTTE